MIPTALLIMIEQNVYSSTCESIQRGVINKTWFYNMLTMWALCIGSWQKKKKAVNNQHEQFLVQLSLPLGCLLPFLLAKSNDSSLQFHVLHGISFLTHYTVKIFCFLGHHLTVFQDPESLELWILFLHPSNQHSTWSMSCTCKSLNKRVKNAIIPIYTAQS